MRQIVFSLIVIAFVLTGCQGGMPAASRPTPTPILLPAAPTQATSVSTVSASSATVVPTGVPSPTLVARQTARPTATPSPRPSPTPTVNRIMALGLRPVISVRAAPANDAAILANLAGSQVTWAEARSADGRWVLVTYGEVGDRGWVERSTLQLLGVIEDLPVRDPAAVAAAPRPAATGTRLSGRVVGEPLNVRRGPGVDQPLVGQLAAGAEVIAVGRSAEGDWLAIVWQGGTAWIAGRYVELSGQPADLPVLASQTTTVPAPIAAAPAGGKIAFQTRSGGDIYLVNADGSGLRRVTDGMDPALSPDGRRLAFARWGAPHGIFVLDLNTGEERRVATANRPRHPTWSPDGTRLVFSRSTRSYVCRETPLGCFEEALIRQFFGGQECVDTPQGRFCISDFPERTVDDTGLSQVTLADGAWLDLGSGTRMQSPVWLPGSNAVLFRTGDGLQLIEAGGVPRPFAAGPDLGSPAPAPTGSPIAVQVRLHDHTDIFLLDAAGQLGARLTAPPPTYARGPEGRAPNNVAPSWSPDGRTILFLSDRDGVWRFYRMNADGSGQAPFLPTVLGGLSFSYDFAAERMISWGP